MTIDSGASPEQILPRNDLRNESASTSIVETSRLAKPWIDGKTGTKESSEQAAIAVGDKIMFGEIPFGLSTGFARTSLSMD